ncbi:hypothetical protein [Methylocucumis oryzae]|uniref:Uncharacterized protein n=1 Tax=Methylocucumis oryzae TaxID=1632867 RepID=A0A0F3IEN3_9GAMM|nr:hypothetical protein [Methylocucumis oryzae]KJV05003.1 hypothetical protein VZ94_21275 [Methylocucumis oryzae]
MANDTKIRSNARWLLRLTTLIIGIAWLIDYLIPHDYCFEQRRKLTDKEYILIVLDKFIKEGKIKLHDRNETAQAYLLHHPKCCSVSKGKNFSVL